MIQAKTNKEIEELRETLPPMTLHQFIEELQTFQEEWEVEDFDDYDTIYVDLDSDCELVSEENPVTVGKILSKIKYFDNTREIQIGDTKTKYSFDKLVTTCGGHAVVGFVRAESQPDKVHVVTALY